MANYSLVINSKFKPFSYQELLAPALMSTQAHQELEEAYTDMSIKANIWDQMADEVRDKKTHTIYKRYADDLEAKAQSLARYGISPSSRQDLLTMRSRYAKEITPIETAYKRREADIAVQREAKLKDPSHFFGRNANEVSLDEYLDNPSLDVISENYSGMLLKQQVLQDVNNLKTSLMKKGALTKMGLPYQYEQLLQYGATIDQVLDAIRRDKNALPILLASVDKVMEASGIRKWKSMNGDWANNDLYKQAEAWAMEGLFGAIGTSEVKHFTDTYSMNDALNANSQARDFQYNMKEKTIMAALAAAEADKKNLKRIALSGISFLKESGKDASLLNTLMSFKGGTQGIKASIFGKKGDVNALKVYEEYRKAGVSNLSANERRTIEEEATKAAKAEWEKKWGTNIPKSQQTAAANALNTLIKQKTNAGYIKASQQKILNKYGVKEVINKEQYDALKAINYNGEQLLSINQLKEAVNNLVLQKQYYSTNMANYDIPSSKIIDELLYLEENDLGNGMVYKMKQDGSKGSAVKIKDLDLKTNSNADGNTISDIMYGSEVPGMVIMQIGSNRYYVDPNVLGSEYDALINKSREELKNADITDRTVSITAGIANLLNSYNQVAPQTSSQVQ